MTNALSTELRMSAKQCILEAEDLTRISRTYAYGTPAEKQDLLDRAHALETAGFMLLNHHELGLVDAGKVGNSKPETGTNIVVRNAGA